MAKKMYYTEAETIEKLKVSPADLAKMVRDNKLRVFPDGQRKMFKVGDVDALAPAEEVTLTAADSTADSIRLEDSPTPPTKEDTVITAEGISIFDDEELEIEAADPMAKTQITQTIEDQVAGDGVGSGSGLLDLTRESDDTSLGAEVLDHIDVEAVSSDMTGESAPAAEGGSSQAQAAAVAVSEPAGVDEMDAASGLFNGLIIGSAIVAFVLALAAAAGLGETIPGYLSGMKANVPLVLVGAVVVAAAAGAVGLFVGKSVAQRQETLKRMAD